MSRPYAVKYEYHHPMCEGYVDHGNNRCGNIAAWEIWYDDYALPQLLCDDCKKRGSYRERIIK